MPNYQNSKVYSIRSLSRPELIYVGSTTQTLSQRMTGHRAPSSKCTSKKIIDIGDSYIELIENYPCADKNELGARENHHMRTIECVNRQYAINDCPHGGKQGDCIECGGSQICEHNRRRRVCLECNGPNICKHQKQRNACKDCEGSSFCEHQKIRNICVQCMGSSICEHKRRKNCCKDCGGSQLCEHQVRTEYCKECSPIECVICNSTHSKAHFKRHLKSQKHQNNIAPQ